MKIYIDNCILVYYIKDVLPEALETDLDIVINICKQNIRDYEKSGTLSKLDRVSTEEYTPKKINQAIYFLLRLYETKYPEYQDTMSRLKDLMRIKIFEEKKVSLRK